MSLKRAIRDLMKTEAYFDNAKWDEGEAQMLERLQASTVEVVPIMDAIVKEWETAAEDCKAVYGLLGQFEARMQSRDVAGMCAALDQVATYLRKRGYGRKGKR
jgi:TRAP-type C4-dicarboxylate transport system substrate-binding protein